MNNKRLEAKARWLRQQVLTTIYETGKGHIGGTFSCVDMLVALYYGGVLNLERGDKLIMGKGHACLAIYNILADLGILDVSYLKECGKNGSYLGGQLNIDTPGVDYNTGSLGHAIGVGAGMALAAKMDNKDYRAFAIIGDGECAEGSIWESVMFAGQHQLNNLIGIVDRNRLSVTDFVEDPRLKDKFRACGWDCISVDGHSFEQILSALSNLDRQTRPLMIIADTIKGKGISFMEDGLKWHHSIPNEEQYKQAMRELND